MLKFKSLVLLIYLSIVGCVEETSTTGAFSEYKVSEKEYYDIKRIPKEHRDGSSYNNYLNDLKIVEFLLNNSGDNQELLTQDLVNSAEKLSHDVIKRYVENRILDEVKLVDIKQYYQEHLDEFSLTNFIVDEYYVTDKELFEGELTLEEIIQPLTANRKELMSNNLTENIEAELVNLSPNELTKAPVSIGDLHVIYRLVESVSITPLYDDVEYRVRSHLIDVLRKKAEAELRVKIFPRA